MFAKFEPNYFKIMILNFFLYYYETGYVKKLASSV